MKTIGKLALSAMFWASAATALPVDTMYYQINQPDRQDLVQWIITPVAEDHYEIQSVNTENGVTQTAICDSRFATLSWRYQDPANNNFFYVERQADKLIFSGQLNGLEENWDKKIGSTPWIQFPGAALPYLPGIDSGNISFFSVKPDNGKLYKMKAHKAEADSIQWKNRSISTRKITVSLSGFFSAFGKVHFWICQETSRFVRFEGFTGIINRDPLTYQLIDYEQAPQKPVRALTLQTTNRAE